MICLPALLCAVPESSRGQTRGKRYEQSVSGASVATNNRGGGAACGAARYHRSGPAQHALIHLLDLQGKLDELPYVGVLFIGLIIVSLVLAEALIRTDDLRVWLMADAVSAATMIGYAISRTAGLPGDDGEDVGNWLEPLGLASLLVEGVVVLLVLGRLADRS